MIVLRTGTTTSFTTLRSTQILTLDVELVKFLRLTRELSCRDEQQKVYCFYRSEIMSRKQRRSVRLSSRKGRWVKWNLSN